MKSEEKREMLRKKHPTVAFLSGTGRKVELRFDKSEYRAYIYNDRYGGWEDMKLGSLSTETLKDYIVKNF